MFQGCDDPECHSCEMNRKMLAAQVAMGAANNRRTIWVDAYMSCLNSGREPSECEKAAKDMLIAFDKAFPEVKAAAMQEDR